MTWDEWFAATWDAFVNTVITVPELGASKVFYGKKFPPVTFPAAYIQPVTAEGTTATFRESAWNIIFRVYIVGENTDPKEGVLEVWRLAGKVIEVLNAHRTLDDTIHNLECTLVTDSPERLGIGMEQHWVSLDVKCTRKI